MSRDRKRLVHVLEEPPVSSTQTLDVALIDVDQSVHFLSSGLTGGQLCQRTAWWWANGCDIYGGEVEP